MASTWVWVADRCTLRSLALTHIVAAQRALEVRSCWAAGRPGWRLSRPLLDNLGKQVLRWLLVWKVRQHQRLKCARRLAPMRPAGQVPEYQRTAGNTLLAWADQLPFKSNTLDYIVSLHNMEHLQDPVQAVLHYMVRHCWLK